MNRLTKRNEQGVAYVAIADTLPKKHQEIECYSNKLLEAIFAIFQKLASYEDLEEQGLLIKLPCNVDDIVYVLEPNGNIQECKVYNITTNIYADSNKDNPYWKGFEIKDNLFGKTVFLTQDEAERALEV